MPTASRRSGTSHRATRRTATCRRAGQTPRCRSRTDDPWVEPIRVGGLDICLLRMPDPQAPTEPYFAAFVRSVRGGPLRYFVLERSAAGGAFWGPVACGRDAHPRRRCSRVPDRSRGARAPSLSVRGRIRQRDGRRGRWRFCGDRLDGRTRTATRHPHIRTHRTGRASAARARHVRARRHAGSGPSDRKRGCVPTARCQPHSRT